MQELEEKIAEEPQRGLLDLLQPGTRLHQHIQALPEHWLGLDEDELVRHAQPTDTDWALRTFFWRQAWKFITAEDKTSFVPMVRIYENVCSRKHFFTVISKPHKLAFLIKPMRLYEDELDVQFMTMMSRISQITRLSIKKDAGDDDWCPQKVNVLLRTAALVFDRKLGQSLQRSLNMNLNKDVNGQQPKPDKYRSGAELDAEIFDLMKRVTPSLPKQQKATPIDE
jgi:hypothetical protein